MRGAGVKEAGVKEAGVNEALVERLDAALPQLQCRRCGYEACRPYAEAVAEGRAAINRCPPGGGGTIRALAALMEVPALEPDPECGAHTPGRVAVIDEPWCIGCTLCLRACPVDAIVGAAKLMHCVIAHECTGCELCVAPCPTGCISMREAEPWSRAFGWTRERSERARRRYDARARRLERSPTDEMRERRRALRLETPEAKRRAIAWAVRRARARRAGG